MASKEARGVIRLRDTVRVREDYFVEGEEDDYFEGGDFEDEEELDYEVENDMIDGGEQGFSIGYYGYG